MRAWPVLAALLLLCPGLAVSAEGEATPLTPPKPAEQPGQARPAPQTGQGKTSPAWDRELSELERQSQDGSAARHKDSTSAVWPSFWGLLFIAALLGGGAWALTKLRLRLAKSPSPDEVRILSRTTIDAKNALLVVRIRGHDYLLGAGPSGVSLLTLLPTAQAGGPPESRQDSGEPAQSPGDGAKSSA